MNMTSDYYICKSFFSYDTQQSHNLHVQKTSICFALGAVGFTWLQESQCYVIVCRWSTAAQTMRARHKCTLKYFCGTSTISLISRCEDPITLQCAFYYVNGQPLFSCWNKWALSLQCSKVCISPKSAVLNQRIQITDHCMCAIAESRKNCSKAVFQTAHASQCHEK